MRPCAFQQTILLHSTRKAHRPPARDLRLGNELLHLLKLGRHRHLRSLIPFLGPVMKYLILPFEYPGFRFESQETRLQANSRRHPRAAIPQRGCDFQSQVLLHLPRSLGRHCCPKQDLLN
jgi:hypothetical protein